MNGKLRLIFMIFWLFSIYTFYIIRIRIVVSLLGRLDIVLHVSSDDILGALPHSRTLM